MSLWQREGRGGGARRRPWHTHPPWRGSGCRPPRSPCAAAVATDTRAAVWWTAAAAPRLSGVSARSNPSAAAAWPALHAGQPQAQGPEPLENGHGWQERASNSYHVPICQLEKGTLFLQQCTTCPTVHGSPVRTPQGLGLGLISLSLTLSFKNVFKQINFVKR